MNKAKELKQMETDSEEFDRTQKALMEQEQKEIEELNAFYAKAITETNAVLAKRRAAAIKKYPELEGLI